MKKLLHLLLASLTLLAGTALPVSAAYDYGLIYDVSALLDYEAMEEINDSLRDLSDTYGTEFRIDIVSDLEEETIEDYANIFIDKYAYGYGDTGNLVYLMLYVSEDDGNLSYLDAYMTAAGENYDKLNIFVLAAEPYLEPYLSAEAWNGSISDDLENLEALRDELALDARAVLTPANAGTAESTAAAESAEAESESIGTVTESVTTSVEPETNTGTQEPLFTGTLAPGYVMDEADILSDAEEEDLRTRAQSISETYHCSVYMAAVNDYHVFGSNDVMESAKNIYRNYELGYGEGRDGFLLMLSMSDRDWALIAYGDFGNASLTDYGRTDMAAAFRNEFRDDDWYGGFSDYLDDAELYLKMSAAGTPFDHDTDPFARKFWLIVSYGIAAIIGLISAFVITGIWKSRMETANAAHSAKGYLVPGKETITSSKDRYLHMTQTRVYDPPSKSDGGSSSSGGTSVGSDGFSGSSGKF